MYVTLNYKIGVELKYSGAPGVQSLANIDPLVLLVCIVDLEHCDTFALALIYIAVLERFDIVVLEHLSTFALVRFCTPVWEHCGTVAWALIYNFV